MKKVRIMLASVAVIAAVGGALAWNANKAEFCAYTASSSGACQATFPNSITQASGSATSFVTFKQKVEGNCPVANDCNQLGIIVSE